MEKYNESDLYKPIYETLTKQGYIVRGEVKNCDIAAIKEDELIIIEMKTAFNLKLIYQAIDRQNVSRIVYVAIPRPTGGQNTKSWKSMIKLIKRLDLGLITVALDSPIKTVDFLVQPTECKTRLNKRKTEYIKKEIKGRISDFNIGGVTRKKIATAYREKAIALACILEYRDNITLKEIKEMNLAGNFSSILQLNYYDWFERVGKGIYKLNQNGYNALEEADFKELVDFYRNKPLGSF